MIQDGSGDGDTLLFATRELERHATRLVVHTYSLQYLMDALVDLIVLLPACRLEHKLQILIDRAICQQLEILEDDSHLPSQGRNLFPSDGQQVVPQHHRLVGFVDIELTIERSHQGSLTRAHASYQIDELAFFDLEVHVSQYANPMPLVNIRILITNQHIISIL